MPEDTQKRNWKGKPRQLQRVPNVCTDGSNLALDTETIVVSSLPQTNPTTLPPIIGKPQILRSTTCEASAACKMVTATPSKVVTATPSKVVTVANANKPSIQNLKFTKGAGTNADAQTPLQEPNNPSDSCLGKQPQADPQPNPFSDVGSEPNPVGGSLLLYPADAQITSQEPDNLASDSRPGKRPRVDLQPNPSSDVSSEANPAGDSLSHYSVSPAPVPVITTEAVPAPSPASGNPPRDDVNMANAFLERLQANAQAQRQSPSVQVPDVPTVAMKYTLQPAGGFPPVFGHNSTYAFNNIDIQQITDWMSLPGPRVFVQPLAHGYYPPAIIQEIVGILKTTIMDIFGCVNPKITAPMASSTPTYADQPPYTYLVHNIPPGVVTDLVKQRCWATEQIGFLVYTAETIMPTYLGAVEGFNATDDEDETMICELIAQTLCQGDAGTVIAEIAKNNLALAELEEMARVRKIVETLRVRTVKIKAQGGSLRSVINMYINCPFDKDEDWNRLVTAVASTEFKHSLLGKGTVHRGWLCTLCHGADHPTGLCPFHQVPGWIKATPIAPIVEFRSKINRSNRDSNSTAGQQSGNQRGRGGRGRFRQRGSTCGRDN